MPTQSRLILYIATSLDGYIATANEDLDWLGVVEQPGEDYGYGAFKETVDTVIMGRRTYDKVASMGVPDPHPDKTMYVITRTPQASKGNIHFHNGDPVELLKQLKSSPGKNIYCDGGAQLVNLLMQHDLFDHFIISFIPIMLGDGIRLFADGRPPQNLRVVSAKSFPKGLVQVHYERVR